MKVWILAVCLASRLVMAADLRDAQAVPQLGTRGVESYKEFLAADQHRAFAIAPGGTWGWHAELPNPKLAEQAAMQTCQAETQQRCVINALDESASLLQCGVLL